LWVIGVYNWKYAAETCAKAILEVNPKVLIVIEVLNNILKLRKVIPMTHRISGEQQEMLLHGTVHGGEET